MKVKLKNIKQIKSLDFSIPKQGVWLITGLNGSGKTSLLAALFRIGSSYAFQKYYKTSSFESRLDAFNNSQVEYSLNGESVTYKYGGERWRATPNRNSNLLSQFPFQTVKFVEANGDRVEPFSDEILPKSVRSAPNEVREFLVSVLDNQKWNNLKYVNTRRGRGSEAYLIPYRHQNQTYYYSEKNFSLGELCVLRLACKLANIQDRSLVLIDEIEMALHPQAQIRLLDKVQQIAKEKKLTILFSTHSATLIKHIDRKHIIFITETSAGNFTSIDNVYPAQVLGEIAFDEEIGADFIFLVEDKQAKFLLEQMIAFYVSSSSNSGLNRGYSPLYKVVPVGGFPQVIELLNASSQIFPTYVKRVAFLDEDVKSEAIPNARQKNMLSLLDKLEQAKERTKFLPCTPEIGLMQLVESNEFDIQTIINRAFSGCAINIGRVISSEEYQLIKKQKIRDQAKERAGFVVDKIHQSTGFSLNDIYKILYRIYCEQKYSGAMKEMHELFGPIFNSR